MVLIALLEPWRPGNPSSHMGETSTGTMTQLSSRRNEMRRSSPEKVGQRIGDQDRHSLKAPGPLQQSVHENSVVVLGVMYPHLAGQPSPVGRDGVFHFPPELGTAGGSSAVVFYDPLSCEGTDQRTPPRLSGMIGAVPRKSTRGNKPEGRRGTREEAIKAVERDLIGLSVMIHSQRVPAGSEYEGRPGSAN